MKKILLFLMLFSKFCVAQNLDVQLMQEQHLIADVFVGVDNFGGKYYISNNVFYKEQGERILQFNDFQLGRINNVDIINPLKIVLFYKTTNTAVILDRNLNEINRINFTELPTIKNIGFVSSAGENKFWIFNIDEQRIELFQGNRNKNLRQTQPVEQEILGFSSNFNFIWLVTPSSIKRFNMYGVLVQELNIEGIKNLVQDNHSLVFKKDQDVFYLPKNGSKPLQLNLPLLDVEQFYLKNEILYIYNNHLLYKYKINLNLLKKN